MTIARALKKLKATEAEIKEFLDPMQNKGPLFVSFKRNTSDIVVGSTLTVENYGKKARGNWDSIKDLIEFHSQLKAKISEANNQTTVEVAGKTMTVARALNYKENTVVFYKQLLDRLRRELVDYQSNENQVRTNIEDNANQIVAAFGKQKPGEATVSENLETLKTMFQTNVGISIVDPIEAEKQIDWLKDQLRQFEEDIDFVLNEKNNLVTIEV
jgi:hypothetical protein